MLYKLSAVGGDFMEFEEYDMYTNAGIEDFTDNDAISASEEGFMMGYLSA